MAAGNSFEHCMKCTLCNDYCPVAKVNPSFPGPKALGPDGERYRLKDAAFYDAMARYCLNCKRCEVACPSDVKIADLILNAKLKYGGRHHVLRNAALSYTDFVGTLGTAFSPVANAAASMMFHRGPRYATRTFEKIYASQVKWEEQSKFAGTVAFFHGCYVNYNNPQLGLDMVKVLNSLGIGVKLLAKEQCCGIALISNGFVKQAERQARVNLDSIRECVKAGLPVLTTSTTCVFTIRDEYEHVLGLDVSDVRNSVMTATKYICSLLDGGARLNFRRNLPSLKIAYHVPCHLEKLGWAMYTVALLKMIPGVELTVLDSACCGVAGTYGFKGENRKISRDVGENLFKQIRELSPDIVVTDCETCRWQIEMNTEANVMHPLTLLASSIE